MSEFQATVLIVDDNETNLDVLTRRITRYGYAVETAMNGRRALQMLRETPFDLVLLDIMMPEMNGYQVLERIKDDPELRNLPVIVISALDDIDSIVKCIQLGAEDYLPKPFNPSLLKARVSASLEKKRLRDREEAHLEEQAITQRIDRELNARLDIKRVAEITLDWAMRRTTAQAAFIGRVMEDEQTLQIVAVGGSAPELTYYLNTEINIRSEEVARAIETIMPQASSGRPDYIMPTSNSRTIMPIGRAGQIIALLLLEDEKTERYENETLSFLMRLTDRAAIAMSNAILYEQVQQANVAKTDFISDVSHELKNPMTSILNYAKMLSSAGEINSMQEQFVDTIISNVKRMVRLVADLGDVTQIESGKVSLSLNRHDLPAILHEVTRSLNGQIETKKQTLTIEISEGLPDIFCDYSRVVQILTNLLSNAYKYTPEGGQLKICAKPAPRKNGSEASVLISVSDNGIGIRDEDQKKIFQRYFRAADEKAQASPGTGLGLNVTKLLVELQNGEIWFESAFRKGTTFYFTLPIWQDQSPS